MLTLEPEEKILLVIRRHWFVMVGPTSFLLIVLVFPSILFVVAPRFSPELLANPEFRPILFFLMNLYILSIILYLFILWADYYLDIWIITTRRLIDIEQKGLFNRNISEMYLKNIQNTSIEIHGIIPTLLKFGDLKVETSGEGLFVIKDIPNLYEAKDIILKYSSGGQNDSHPKSPGSMLDKGNQKP